jgi:hypothetical protein
MTALTDLPLGRLRAIIRAYAPDLPDITCSEVLLVVYELCEILGIEEKEMVRLFGRRAFGYLRHWGDRPVPPYPPLPPARGAGAKRSTRAWLWLDGEAGPRFVLVDKEKLQISFMRPLSDPGDEPGDEPGTGPGDEPGEEGTGA